MGWFDILKISSFKEYAKKWKEQHYSKLDGEMKTFVDNIINQKYSDVDEPTAKRWLKRIERMW